MPLARPENDLAYLQSGIGADLDTMLIFSLLRTHAHLGPLLDADLRRQKLTAAQLNTLLVLRQAGQAGLLMNQIGQRLVVTKANVTGLIDRLESQGLVARAEHSDRRATIVRITRAGTHLLIQALPAHAQRLASLAECLSIPEKQTLIRLLSKLRAGLRSQQKETAP